MFAGWIAKLGLGLLWNRAKTNAKADWQAISPKVRLWIIGAIVVTILGVAHQWYAHRQLNKRYDDGYKQAVHDEAEKLKNANARIEALSAEIAADERKKNDEVVDRIDAHANAISVRGPGKAVCPGVPAAPGGYQARPGAVVPDVARVPYPEWQQLIALPFDDTVAFGKQCDVNAAEVRAWHSWYDRLVAAWPKPKS
jgi:hypothetical protein